MYQIVNNRIYSPGGCEINVVYHCNLSCRACNHLSPVMKKQFADPKLVYQHCSVLAKYYAPHHIKLLGGEPLLHPQILDVVDAVRNSEICRNIQLWTNGTLLSRLTSALWKKLDKVHIPADLVVNHWLSAVESSSPLDFLSLHAMWTLFGRLIGYKIMSIISVGCNFTTKSGGIWDFVGVARSWLELEDWMWSWVHDIGTLYKLNGARLKAWDDTLPLEQQSLAFVECHKELKNYLSQMQARCQTSLQEPDLHLAQDKVLSSLDKHWDGLTVFVERPEVAIDNNTAERALRNPVVSERIIMALGGCGAHSWPR